MTIENPPFVCPVSLDSSVASTPPTVDDLVRRGGGAALRSYVAGRLASADAVEVGTAKEWSAFAVTHLKARAGDQADHGVEVSCASLQMVLAYIEWLEKERENAA